MSVLPTLGARTDDGPAEDSPGGQPEQLNLLCRSAAIDVAAETGIPFRSLTDTDVDGADLAARMDVVSALLVQRMRERDPWGGCQ